MKKEKKEKRKGLVLTREEMKEIAFLYAQKDGHCSVKFISKLYNLPEHTVRNALDKAVIESMVDLDIVYQMRRRAWQNAYFYGGEPGKIRSNNHYDDLVLKRMDFLPHSKVCVSIAQEFAYSGLSLEAFASKVVYTEFLLRRIVDYCIEEDLLPALENDLLREKMYF